MSEEIKEIKEQSEVETPPKSNYMSTEEFNTRIKGLIVVCLTLTLMGIVFVVLYSIIFVTQPLDAISPIDAKFFELIIPLATFLTGTLSGYILSGSNKDDKNKCKEVKP